MNNFVKNFFYRVKILTHYWSGKPFEQKIDPVQFFSDTSLHLPLPEEVHLIQWIGRNSALPPAYTDAILEEITTENSVFHDFLHIATQRLAMLTYHAYLKRHISSDYWLRDKILQHWIQHHTGCYEADLSAVISSHAFKPFFIDRCAKNFEAIMRSYWNVDVRVLENVGTWIAIPEIYQHAISIFEKNNRLGLSLFLGKKRVQKDSGMVIECNPLTYDQYEHLRKVSMSALFKKFIDFFAGKPTHFILRMRTLAIYLIHASFELKSEFH